jgi:hypothetical protein
MRRTSLCILAAVLATQCSTAGSAGPSVDGSRAEAATGTDARPDVTDAAHRVPDAPADAADARRVDAKSSRVPDARPDATDGGDDAPLDAPRPDAGATCNDGAPVAYLRSSCPGAPASVPSPLATAAAAASFGDVISLSGLDEASLPCFPVRVCVASGAPTLVFSDEPESPSSDGILYADTLTVGAYRAYVYHTNAGTGLRKFPVVLLNQGTATVHAVIRAVGIAGPSQDYVDVGKQAALRWYISQGTTTTVDVPAGTRVLLDADLDAVQAATNELAHAIIDFTVDGPVKLSVVSVLASEDATVVTATLPLLTNTGQHMRGSFPGAALEIEPLAPVDGTGARRLRMGGNVTDASLTGVDVVDGNAAVTLDGNYGLSYAMNLAFSAGSAILLSPQGGAWGGAGSVLTGGSVSAGPGVLPAAQDSLGTQTDAIFLATFAAGVSSGVDFLSAGGSSLPVDVVTVPLP